MTPVSPHRRRHQMDRHLAAAARAYSAAMTQLRTGTTSTRIVRALIGHGDRLEQHGHYREAAKMFRTAVRCAGRANAADHLDTARALNGLAVCYKYLARFDEAETLYVQAIAIARQRGADDQLLATILHNRGGLAHAAGRSGEGEPFARESVRLRTRALGPHHPDVATDLAALAALLDQQRKYAEAERLYRRALRIIERALGPDDIEISASLNNLAAIAAARGNPRRAEAMYRRAHAITVHHCGHHHPQSAVIAHNLATLLLGRGRLDEALLLSRQAIRVFSTRLGREHPYVAICLDLYARILTRLGRTRQAERCAERALLVRRHQRSNRGC